MSRRDNADRRCPRCRVLDDCVCALVPRLETRTRLLLLIHEDEARKPTNTGLLAARCLGDHADVRIIPAGPRDPVRFADDEAPLLLFPADDAVPLRDVPAPPPAGRRRVLIVPDGTWRQTRKMRARVPGLKDVPCVVLDDDDGGATAYHLRAERRPGGLATLEAIARAFAILEGDPAVAEAMLVPFRAFVTATLKARGVVVDDAGAQKE